MLRVGSRQEERFPNNPNDWLLGSNVSVAYGRGSQPAGVCALSSSAGSMRGRLSHAPCMCQLQGWAQTAASRMDNRRTGSAPHSSRKRWKWKIKDLSLLYREGRQGAKSLRKSRNDFS